MRAPSPLPHEGGAENPSVDRCTLCSSPDVHRLFTVEDGFSVAECRGCAAVVTVPLVDDAEIGSYYPQEYYGRGGKRFNPVFESLIRWFRARRARAIERFVPHGRILDVGCGRGLLPALMRERGWDAHGLEVSATAAHHARDVLGIPVFVGDLLSSPYPPASFDVVVIYHVLEHMRDPIAALKRAHEILRPGGLLVVAVPNFESLQARVTNRHWFHLDVPRHYHHFRLSWLSRLLGERGFSVAKVSHFSLEQNPYGWIQSLLNQLGFRFNLLYDFIRNSSARTVRRPLLEHPMHSAMMVVAMLAVVPLSLGLFLLEVMLRRGGTVDIYAVRNERT